jgi:hypothetical protein
MELLQLLQSPPNELPDKQSASNEQQLAPVEMARSPSYIVKNTFIDVVESPSVQRARAFTDSALVIDTPVHKESIVVPYFSDVSTEAASEPEEVSARHAEIAIDELPCCSMPADLPPCSEFWMQMPQAADPWNMPHYDTSQFAWDWAPACCPQQELPIPLDHCDHELADASQYYDGGSPCAPTSFKQSEGKTTVMFRNLPNDYCRSDLLDLLDRVGGFAGLYDFVYLPVDFKTQAGLGYAFVNFVAPAYADQCFNIFEGFSNWSLKSCKVCNVTWGNPLQGLQAHVERYRDSPVMHKSVPDEWKPMLFADDGSRVKFPPPTKAIKPPKLRNRAAAGL